jgi:hypothetical protein
MNKLPKILQGKNQAIENVFIKLIQVMHKIIRKGKKESQTHIVVLDNLML